jgi:hypothetical protein
MLLVLHLLYNLMINLSVPFHRGHPDPLQEHNHRYHPSLPLRRQGLQGRLLNLIFRK